MVIVRHAVRRLDFQATVGSLVFRVHGLLFHGLDSDQCREGKRVARRPTVAIPAYTRRGCRAVISYIPRRRDAGPGVTVTMDFQPGDGYCPLMKGIRSGRRCALGSR